MRPDKDSFKFLLGSSALSVMLWFLPLAWLAVYPFRLFVTFIHEGGHALATLLTLGSVEAIRIHLNGSGETYSRGGMSLLIASAGYLASTAYGASLLLLCRRGRNAKAVLTTTAAVILGLTAFFTKGWFGWLAGLGLVLLLLVVVLVASARLAHFFLSFLAVQCCLNALFDLGLLFQLSTTSTAPNDALTMQRLTWMPAPFWATLWLATSLLVLWFALRSYARQEER